MDDIIELLKSRQKIGKEILQQNKNIKELIQKLERKNCSLEDWQEIAIIYYKIEYIEEFKEIIDYLIQIKIKEKKYEDEKFNTIKIKIINSLSAYYLSLAAMENEGERREEYFDKMKSLLNLSDKITIEESLTFALKGFLFFYQGEFKKAQQYLTQSQMLNEKCVSAILGKAIIEYHQENYLEAIKLYIKVIRLNPSVPVQIKIGLANSYLYTNNYTLAQFWYQKIYNQNPLHIHSILGLANIAFKQADYQAYQKYLQLAYNIDKYCPELLVILAEQTLITQNYYKSRYLSQVGYKYLQKRSKFIQSKQSRDQKQNEKKAKNDFFILKSKFLFILGFCAHQEQDYSKAQKYYKESIQADEYNYQAYINLGQIYIAIKNFIDALKCFEYVLQNQKKKFEEIYKLLGYLYSKNGKRQESIVYYQLALKYDQNDYDVLIEYANILESSDEQESLDAYLKALEIMKQQNINIHPELYNNIAVLKLRLNSLQEGYQALIKAKKLNQKLEESANQQERLKGRAIVNCIDFNMGYFFEKMYQLGLAYETYKMIISRNPYYVDAYIKLSYLAWLRGSFQKAIEYSDLAIKQMEMTKQRPDLCICWKAFIIFKEGDYNSSKQLLEEIKNKYEFDDIYGQLMIGFINYKISIGLRQKPEEQRYYLKKMMEIAKEKLMQDPANVQAAMMIGSFMAELSYFRESKEIFNQIYVGSILNNNIQLNISYLEFLQGIIHFTLNFIINQFLNVIIIISLLYPYSNIVLYQHHFKQDLT